MIDLEQDGHEGVEQRSTIPCQVEASLDGMKNDLVRIVGENEMTLMFPDFSFERE